MLLAPTKTRTMLLIFIVEYQQLISVVIRSLHETLKNLSNMIKHKKDISYNGTRQHP